MKCNRSESAILYFYNELNDSERREFEQHIRECKECQTEIQNLKECIESYNSMSVDNPSEEVLDRILAKSKRNIGFQWGRLFPKVAFAGVSMVLVVGVITGYLLLHKQPTNLQWNNIDEQIALVSDNINKLQIESAIPISMELNSINEDISNLQTGLGTE